jgi:hypothetical protein
MELNYGENSEKTIIRMVMRHYGNVEKLEANVSNGHEQGPSEILLHSSPKYAHAHRIITHPACSVGWWLMADAGLF